MRPSVPGGSVSLDPDDTCPGQARNFLRAFCQGFSLGADIVDAAILLVSELATNASRQHEGPVTVTATVRQPAPPPDGAGCHLRVDVTDRALGRPTLGTVAEPLAESGRGLALVDILAERWGVETGTSGKTVWFELLV